MKLKEEEAKSALRNVSYVDVAVVVVVVVVKSRGWYEMLSKPLLQV